MILSSRFTDFMNYVMQWEQGTTRVVGKWHVPFKSEKNWLKTEITSFNTKRKHHHATLTIKHN